MYSVTRNYCLGLFCALMVCAGSLSAQITIAGVVEDAQSGDPIPGIAVSAADQSTLSGEDGRFSLVLSQESSSVVLSFSKAGFRREERAVKIAGAYVNIGRIRLEPQESAAEQLSPEDLIPVVILSEENGDGNLQSQAVPSLLNASQDAFSWAAGFMFGPGRFLRRGYDLQYATVFLNGIPVNDLSSGATFWSNWGGLNDVFRSRLSTPDLSPSEVAFGGVGGVIGLDTRASQQRRQLRVSYALTNRTYTNRLMATWSSGMLPSGWAITVSGSRRWAEEGYVEGTFYDGYSYFLSLDRQLGRKHLLNFTAFGAPLSRGQGGVATQEMNELAGTNFYNPNWGFQNGEKRNARVTTAHQPYLILRHDWSASKKTRITTAAAYHFGRFGSTFLDWYDAPDPRPDYYRKLPSYIDNEQSRAVEALLRENQAARQIDWDFLLRVNQNNFLTVENADGIPGNTVSGNRAQYVVEERRSDTRRMSVNTNIQHQLGENITLRGGLNYQAQRIAQFKTLEDLLGADFYLDIDKFAEFDSTGNSDFFQNDLERPNGIVREGDRFGYDFFNELRSGEAWLQSEWRTPHFDFFLAGNLGMSRFWRVGNVRNGRFPDASLGESPKESFTSFGGKGGVTYKLNGRNYFVLNGTYSSRAPFMNAAFVSQRTRNLAASNLTNEKIYGVEGGYLLRTPFARLHLVGYFTRFDDQISSRTFYLDNALVTGGANGLVNYIMTDIDTRHMGLEIAGSAKITPAIQLSAAASIGEFVYANRPEVEIIFDNSTTPARSETVYIKNFHVPNTPQQAYSFKVSYNSPKFWFVNASFNYVDDIWLDFNPDRRTRPAISYVDNPQFDSQVVDPASDLWRSIVYQEKASGGYTIDLFGGKSWKIDNFFVYFNLGISNLLDRQDLSTGGFEQLRFDYETKDVNRFPNRYFYSFGRTYFASLALRM